MKQKEKSQISKEKILNAAIIEFGTKTYESASLNNICSDNNISKGLIYHNYKNKDELFLCCVRETFDALVNYLKDETFEDMSLEESIKKYLDLRRSFFKENCHFSNIFFNIVLQPPVHLKKEIKILKKELDDLNVGYYREFLGKVKLRKNVSEEEAIEYFCIFQEFFNGYFQSKMYELNDFNALINEHEMKLNKILNIMLYGVIKGGD